MATYKVIQDIEAEDKLVGPLTLKQFIFAAVAAICLYLSVLAVTKGAAFMLAVLLPPAIFMGFFAWPWSRDQPTEIWALAKLRFFFKPRRRIWDQSGVKELVTITVPKLEKHEYTNGLDQDQVKSRLQALANTIDSRGWAVKNVNVNLFGQASYVTEDATDRLITPSNLPQEVSGLDITPGDDILDEHNNPTAQHLDQMISQSSQAHQQQMRNLVQHPQSGSQQSSAWFVPPSTSGKVTDDDLAVLNNIHKAKQRSDISEGHLRKIHSSSEKAKTESKKATSHKDPGNNTDKTDPVIQELATRDDWDVATIARQAHKRNQPPDDEVVISLR